MNSLLIYSNPQWSYGLETLDLESIDLAFEYKGLDPAMYEHLVRIEGNIYIRMKSTICSPLHLSYA